MKENEVRIRRLRILGEDEIAALFGRPRFTHEERQYYFDLSAAEKSALASLHTISSRIYYILQLGYFKARYQFFAFDWTEVKDDITYIQQQYFPDFQLEQFEISKPTRLKQQQLILTLCHYRPFDDTERQAFTAKAQKLVRISSQPIYIFHELMQYLTDKRVVLPPYTFWQDTIGQTIKQEQTRLAQVALAHLTDADKTTLQSLLDNPQGLYELTLLKREPKDFSYREIGDEIKRAEQIGALYHRAKSILSHLRISNESIKYYASLVNYYTVFQLDQLDQHLVFIYLLCFIYHRYQKLHDNLINSFIYHVRQYIDEAKNVTKERVYAYRVEHNQNLQKAGQVLKLFSDESIADDTPFEKVKTRAFQIIEPQLLNRVATQIADKAQFDETAFQWDALENQQRQFKIRLRPILRVVDFVASVPASPLIEAVDFLKAAFKGNKALTKYEQAKFPMRFVPDGVARYLYETSDEGQKKLLVDRYEFLVYRQLFLSNENRAIWPSKIGPLGLI